MHMFHPSSLYTNLNQYTASGYNVQKAASFLFIQRNPTTVAAILFNPIYSLPTLRKCMSTFVQAV